jgi:hypothetical protein
MITSNLMKNIINYLIYLRILKFIIDHNLKFINIHLYYNSII